MECIGDDLRPLETLQTFPFRTFGAFAGIHEYLRVSFIKQKGTHKQRVRSSARNIKPIHPVSCFRNAGSTSSTTRWLPLCHVYIAGEDGIQDLDHVPRCCWWDQHVVQSCQCLNLKFPAIIGKLSSISTFSAFWTFWNAFKAPVPLPPGCDCSERPFAKYATRGMTFREPRH
jgi:hypothetical protein